MARKKVFDPSTNRVKSEADTTSGRIRNKLRDPYNWYFCDLCYRATEYSIALEYQGIFKKLPKGHAKEVPLTDEIRVEAQQMANSLVELYQQALEGKGPHTAVEMRLSYCDLISMEGDFSLDSFRDQVERRCLILAWARKGNMLGALQLPGHKEGDAKPSKFFCTEHNPRRSIQARRNYQRDRSYFLEYQYLITEIWNRNYSGLVPSWDLTARARVRRDAYKFLPMSKKNIRLIDWKINSGITNLAEIGRRLVISRQAVSKALKRHVKDDVRVRKAINEEYAALVSKISKEQS